MGARTWFCPCPSTTPLHGEVHDLRPPHPTTPAFSRLADVDISTRGTRRRKMKKPCARCPNDDTGEPCSWSRRLSAWRDSRGNVFDAKAAAKARAAARRQDPEYLRARRQRICAAHTAGPHADQPLPESVERMKRFAASPHQQEQRRRRLEKKKVTRRQARHGLQLLIAAALTVSPTDPGSDQPTMPSVAPVASDHQTLQRDEEPLAPPPAEPRRSVRTSIPTVAVVALAQPLYRAATAVTRGADAIAAALTPDTLSRIVIELGAVATCTGQTVTVVHAVGDPHAVRCACFLTFST